MFLKTLHKKTRIILIFQSICMLSAAGTHILWIMQNGFFSLRNNIPIVSVVFWDSLTLIDITAALLLLIRPKAGMVLTMFVIIIDVIHNNIIVFLSGQHINNIGLELWAVKYWMLVAQIFFMIFVVLTFKSNLTEITLKTEPDKI